MRFVKKKKLKSANTPPTVGVFESVNYQAKFFLIDIIIVIPSREVGFMPVFKNGTVPRQL